MSLGSLSPLCVSLTAANNSTTCFSFWPLIRRRPNTVFAWPDAFSTGPGRRVSRWILSPLLRVLVIVDWPLSSGVSRRILAIDSILKLVNTKDKLVKVQLV